MNEYNHRIMVSTDGHNWRFVGEANYVKVEMCDGDSVIDLNRIVHGVRVVIPAPEVTE